MENVNWIAVLVALLGAGGLGAAVREVLGAISLARKGISGREQQRRDDIVAQRDRAIADAEAADARADRERELRIIWRERAALFRLEVIRAGQTPSDWPEENTEPTSKKETP